MGRILSAGILGGLLVFGWGFVAHTVLPLGHMGIQAAPDEEALAASLKSHLPEHGLYFVPGPPADDSEEAEAAAMAKYEAGPRALVVFHPEGGQAMSPMNLGLQFGSCVLGAILAALVVGQIAGYGTRVLCVMLMGLFAWTSISFPHWNWYLFPTEFTLQELINQAAGWLLGGIGIAAVVGRRAS